MRVKEVTLYKNYKVGLPLYSSCDVGIHMTFEVKEGEKVNWDNAWDEINQQLIIQTGTVDPSWITRDELKNEWKYTFKVPKAKKQAGLWKEA